jgi:MYXO-CTERM domain-containing protein
MKKLLLLAALFATTVSAFAQGRVVFNNTASTNYRLWSNNVLGNASNLISGVNAYRVGLYAAQGAGQPEGSLNLVGLATNIALAGYFNGGNPFALPAPFAGGDTITFQVRGWTLGAGTTYAQAVAAQALDPLNVALGQSPLGFTVITADPAPPGALFGTAPGQLNRGFEIKPAPEPSSIALGLLGLGAIALFRRRK